ncbi:MAG: ATP-grasp domain-containing protein [Micromonosporaceae bacterium]
MVTTGPATAARVAIATCRRAPDIDRDDVPLVAPLRGRGISVTPEVWDDPDVDWDSYDLTVIRSTWDYPPRRDAFLEWTRRVSRLANPADVVAWNTDKRYLATLDEVGVPVVPTTCLLPGERWQTPADGEWVVKPAVSVGSLDTGRYDVSNPAQRQLATELISRLHDAGRVAMVQPYLSAVDTYGETALLFFNGEFSHAIRKGPMLDGPYDGAPGLYKWEDIGSREPSAAERDVAEKVLSTAGDPYRLLYARVDLIPGPDGPLLVELELTEPSVYLRFDSGAGERFAAAIEATLAKDLQDAP